MTRAQPLRLLLRVGSARSARSGALSVRLRDATRRLADAFKDAKAEQSVASVLSALQRVAGALRAA